MIIYWPHRTAAEADYPATRDVRATTLYASGSKEGTLAVPDPSKVIAPTATDDTVGTADVIAESVIITATDPEIVIVLVEEI